MSMKKQKAEIYVESIDLNKYLPKKDCYKCGFSCKEFSKLILEGLDPEKCPHLSEREIEYIRVIQKLKDFHIPLISSTIRTRSGLVLSNPSSITLVTSNFPYTQLILGEVLASAKLDCNLLIIDTEGYSVDMAVYLNIFKAEKIIELENELEKIDRKEIVIPGLAKGILNDLKNAGFKTILGPICCLELPIFLLKTGLV
ncbi:hypothetical protein DRP04_01450 [Archaeoglobales archaeon]|nr:MAG: hypothetical protein DRP04_01450 [Archaeoglobales archaeon]